MISSVMVFGLEYPDGVDEGFDITDVPRKWPRQSYIVTKVESELEAMKFHQVGGMEVLVIRPGDVYGPKSVPWVIRPVQLLQRGLFILPSDCRRGVFNHVYVDNLVDGIFLALDKDKTGTPYVITDDADTTPFEFYSRLGMDE